MLGTSKAHGQDKENKIRTFGVVSLCYLKSEKRGRKKRNEHVVPGRNIYHFLRTCGEC